MAMSSSDANDCQMCEKALSTRKAIPISCDHVFHIKCIEKWVKDNRDVDGRCQCPMRNCKESFSEVAVFQKKSGNKCYSITIKAKSGTCGICFASLTQCYASPACCVHKFCRNCLTKWAANNPTCPMCRGEFQEMLVHDRNGSRQEKVDPGAPFNTAISTPILTNPMSSNFFDSSHDLISPA
nr:zinc finger protein [Hymenolepis microstoma]